MNSILAFGWAWLALSACWVDETGYGDTDDAPASDVLDGSDDDLEATTDDEETAVFDARVPYEAGVVLTAATTLGSTATSVRVVGVPGHAPPSIALVLGVEGTDQVVPVATTATGSFVGSVDAALGDGITVDGPDNAWTYTVVDDLTEVGAVEATAADWTVTDGRIWPSGAPLVPPYVVYAVHDGAVVPVWEEGKDDVSLPFEAGETYCVALLGLPALASVEHCVDADDL